MHAIFQTENLVHGCDDNIETDLTEICMSMWTLQIYIRVDSIVVHFSTGQ